MMTESSLPDALARLAPFHHDIEIAPGVYTNPGTRRIRHAQNIFFPGLLRLCGGSLEGLRVLDVGCNCGGFSFLAKRFGARDVVGIDCREVHITQANAIRDELGLSGIRFEHLSVEELDENTLGLFDVVFLMGILYHLQDPIGVAKRMGRITTQLAVIDSHVHFNVNANEEDYPRWWMLRDTDIGLVDGIFEGEEGQVRQLWNRFQHEVPIDYSMMPSQFTGSPQSQREQKFSELINPVPINDAPMPESIYAKEPGSLVLVPNRKAIIDLLRDVGFEDILDIVPHRFSEVRYLRRYRIGLFALKRQPNGPFPISSLRRSENAMS